MNYIDLHTHSSASDGSFTPEEVVELAKAAGIEPISLGRRILRTETAGLALLSVIMMSIEMKNLI